MIYGTYLSATGISQARAKQDVIANNLANAETTGFRRLLTLESERPPEAGNPEPLRGITGGNVLMPTRVDPTAGALTETGNPLDLAIIGDGYLAVERDTPAGPKLALTRDGRLGIDANGTLTLAGQPDARVLGDDGRVIRLGLGTTAEELTINEAGEIAERATGRSLATLRMSVPADASKMSQIGGGLLDPNGLIEDADAGVSVQGGFVEGSNVDPTTELTRMMEVSRHLEANANMIRFQDESLGRLIEASAVS